MDNEIVGDAVGGALKAEQERVDIARRTGDAVETCLRQHNQWYTCRVRTQYFYPTYSGIFFGLNACIAV